MGVGDAGAAEMVHRAALARANGLGRTLTGRPVMIRNSVATSIAWCRVGTSKGPRAEGSSRSV